MTSFQRYLLLASSILLLNLPVYAERKVTLGALLSLTGDAAPHGKAIVDGIQLAAAEYRDKGITLELDLEDDGTEPRKTLTALNSLLHRKRRIIIGPTWGVLAEATQPVFKRSGAISIQPVNSAEFVPGDNSQSYFMLTPPSQVLPALTEALRPFAGKRAAIYYLESNWGRLWERLFTQAATAAGVEIVRTDVGQYGDSIEVVRSFALKQKNSKVDLVLSTTPANMIAETVRQFETLRHPVTIVGPDLIDSFTEKLLTAETNFVEGIGVHPDSSLEFRKRYQRSHGKMPAKYTEYGYEAAVTIMEAMLATNSEDPAQIARYFLNKTDRMSTVGLGRIKFNQHHDIEGAPYIAEKVLSRRLVKAD